MLDRDSSERAPTLAETIRRAIAAELIELRVSLPAVVTSYDPSTRKASCRILVKEAFLDESDQRQVESMPVVNAVPVVMPGTGLYGITFPISDGSLVIGGSTIPATTGELRFSDRSLDRWLTGNGQEVDPEIDHMHALADGIFVPGLYPFGAVPQASPTDHVALGEVSGNDFVALAQKVLNELSSIVNAFNTHTHPYVNVTAPATTSAPTAPMSSPNSVAATQVKAK